MIVSLCVRFRSQVSTGQKFLLGGQKGRAHLLAAERTPRLTSTSPVTMGSIASPSRLAEFIPRSTTNDPGTARPAIESRCCVFRFVHGYGWALGLSLHSWRDATAAGRQQASSLAVAPCLRIGTGQTESFVSSWAVRPAGRGQLRFELRRGGHATHVLDR